MQCCGLTTAGLPRPQMMGLYESGIGGSARTRLLQVMKYVRRNVAPGLWLLFI